MSYAFSGFWYWLNSKILVSSEGIITLQKSFFHIGFYEIQVSFLLQNNEGIWENKNPRGV